MKYLMAKGLVIASLIIGLSACGGGDVEKNPPAQQTPQSDVYTGPAAATADIQKYKASLWDNISTQDKCGACHTEGNQ
ncbi:hypothetical protein, partial [Shewanella sp. S1-49-MNA-CIBAN-0167]